MKFFSCVGFSRKRQHHAQTYVKELHKPATKDSALATSGENHVQKFNERKVEGDDDDDMDDDFQPGDKQLFQRNVNPNQPPDPTAGRSVNNKKIPQFI